MDFGIYKIDGSPFTSDDISVYIGNTVDRVFAILVTYEECSSKNNPTVKIDDLPFGDYTRYINRLITEFNGIYQWLGIKQFFEISGVLRGMTDLDEITERVRTQEQDRRDDKITQEELNILVHKEIKRLTFHCISILNKAKVM